MLIFLLSVFAISITKSVTCDVKRESSPLCEIFPLCTNICACVKFRIALIKGDHVACLVAYMSEHLISTVANAANNLTGEVKSEDMSKGWQAFQIIFWTWLSAATVIGNGLVLVCVLLRKRHNSSTFKFYGSLALGDLLVG